MTFARHEVPSTTTQKLLRGCCVDISSSCEATSKRRALVYMVLAHLAECHLAECHLAECHRAESHHAEFHLADFLLLVTLEVLF